MTRRTPRLLLAALVVMALSPAASPATAEAAKLTPIANLKHATAPGATQAAKGSDIEFATIDVTDLAGAPEGVEGERTFAFAGTITIDGVASSGLQIVDITDPANPTRAAVFACTLSQGDVQVFTRDDMPGKTFATYTADGGGTASSACYTGARDKGFDPTRTNPTRGTFIIDVSNPYAPETVSFVHIPLGSHNQTVHPSGRYLYNSNNELTRPATAAVEYFDITDLTAPKKLGDLALSPGLDSHDLTFNAKGDRAYVAAITHTLILDTSKPESPSVIGRIVDPTVGIMHQSDPVTLKDPILGERTFVVITDEFAGAAGNGWCPGGGLTVYDVTGDLERTPVKVGYWNAPEVRVAGGGTAATGTSLRCTSHVLRFHPDEQIMTIGWYNAGVRVVDISGLVGASLGVTPATGNVTPGMAEIASHWFPNSESWAAKTPEIAEDGSFHLFSNDITRGLDVYRFEPGTAPSANPGRWLTAAQANAQLPRPQLSGSALAPYCLLIGEGA